MTISRDLTERAAALTVARSILLSTTKPGAFSQGKETLEPFDVFDLLRVAEWLLGASVDDPAPSSIRDCCATTPTVADLEKAQAEREAQGPKAVPADVDLVTLADAEDIQFCAEGCCKNDAVHTEKQAVTEDRDPFEDL